MDDNNTLPTTSGSAVELAGNSHHASHRHPKPEDEAMMEGLRALITDEIWVSASSRADCHARLPHRGANNLLQGKNRSIEGTTKDRRHYDSHGLGGGDLQALVPAPYRRQDSNWTSSPLVESRERHPSPAPSHWSSTSGPLSQGDPNADRSESHSQNNSAQNKLITRCQTCFSSVDAEGPGQSQTGKGKSPVSSITETDEVSQEA